MPWILFIDRVTGDLVSEGSAVPDGIDAERYEARDVGARPDWRAKRWNAVTRALDDRPSPIFIDRLDDIEVRLLGDPDFSAAWDAMTAARKTRLRAGIRRVLASILRDLQFRQDDEPVELG